LKTATQGILGAVILVLVAANPAPAVVDQALQIQSTNLVLSWPSPGGHQQYLIQYRQTLDATTPWTELTNAYPANSTNRTTYTIYGVVPPPPSGGGSGLLDTNPPPSPMSATQSAPTEPMAAPANGSGSIVPLALYPPGFDLSSFLIYDPGVADWVSGVTYVRPAPATELLSRPIPQDGPDPDSPPSSGFFRVFHIPNWSFNVTNYTYDGPTFFPVDFADYMDRLDDFTVLLNGEETEYAEFMPYVSGGQTNWGMGVYFDRLSSGSYTIQLRCALRLNDAVGDDAVYLVLTNQAKTIVVNNQITFTNWNETIQGDTYTFDAQIANQNSDWSIDIYDAWDNYVNTGSGHTSNGHITWTWDITDYLGNSRDDFDSDPYFTTLTSFSTAGNGPTTTRYNPNSVKGYPNVGGWVISYQDRWFSDASGYSSTDQANYITAMHEIQGGPALKLDPNWALPIKCGTNVYSQADRNGSWATLASWLSSPDVRNWYYYGHGGPYSIGCDMHTLDTNGLVVGSALTSSKSQSRLTTYAALKAIKSNRYRFVFLDGCDTALGNWPGAFSVSKTTHDLSFYQNDPKHRRPSAFIGWGTEPGGEGWGTIEHYWDFRSYWMGFWANSIWEPLHDALDDGCRYSNWIDMNKFWSGIRLYGYSVMQMEDYNHKGDWRYP